MKNPIVINVPYTPQNLIDAIGKSETNAFELLGSLLSLKGVYHDDIVYCTIIISSMKGEKL